MMNERIIFIFSFLTTISIFFSYFPLDLPKPSNTPSNNALTLGPQKSSLDDMYRVDPDTLYSSSAPTIYNYPDPNSATGAGYSNQESLYIDEVAVCV